MLREDIRYVYDGPMETRIQYGTTLELDKEMSIFVLVDSVEGRAALSALYRQDIEAAQGQGVPIVLNAPTYRASPTHMARVGYTRAGEIDRVNRASVQMVEEIRGDFADFGALVTAPIGPRFAGYHPDGDDSLQQMIDYHAPQAESLAATNVDFISVAAMPGAIDAVGAATAVSRTSKPYTVGFILTANGTLLDGTPVIELINRLDSTLQRLPLFYVIGCTHPTVCASVLEAGGPALARIQGVKANGSSLSPAELLALDRPVADPPESFADALIALGEPRAFRVFGGCCGTDTGHVESVARRLRKEADPLA